MSSLSSFEKELSIEPIFDAGQRGVRVTSLQGKNEEILFFYKEMALDALVIEDEKATEEQLHNLSQTFAKSIHERDPLDTCAKSLYKIYDQDALLL